VYRRGELGATLQATIGKSMYDQDDGEGIVTRSQVRDFLIDTYALLSSIIGTLPRRGDPRSWCGCQCYRRNIGIAA
jgi:hypothetical protein